MSYFNKRLGQLLAVDKIRLCKIGEIVQYTLVFLILVLIAAHIINTYIFSKFPDTNKEDKEKENKNKFMKLLEQLLRLFLKVIIVVITFFYIKKVGLIVPSIPAMLYPRFRPYTTLEYTIHIALVVLFIELLPSFKEEIELWHGH